MPSSDPCRNRPSIATGSGNRSRGRSPPSSPIPSRGSLDVDGLRREIDHNIDAGSGVLLMTYWDGLHSVLSTAKSARSSRSVVARCTDGRWSSRPIASGGRARRSSSLVRARGRRRHADGAAADLCGIVTTRASSRTIARSRSTSPSWPSRALRPAAGARPARHPDARRRSAECRRDQGRHRRRVRPTRRADRARALGRRPGGLKQDHLASIRTGATATCRGTCTSCRRSRTLTGARSRPGTSRVGEIIRDYDYAWFDFSETLTGGFDAMYHGAQEIFGIAGRWRRSPYQSLTERRWSGSARSSPGFRR